jgi:GxxExxY protein
MYNNLPETTELTAKQIVDIAIKIHKALGPGLLESVYEKCFCHELSLRGIPFVSQKLVEIIYTDISIDKSLRIGILVDEQIIVEIKAQENPHPIWEPQLLSYLKLTKKRLGFIINFDVVLMKNGIKRIIL